MKNFFLFVVLFSTIYLNAQDRQRYQTSSPTFIQNKTYNQTDDINELQRLLNQKKKEDWETNIPIAILYYKDGQYSDCINLCKDVLYRTGWSNPYVYFMLGDSYRNIKYYKSAKRYLTKAKKAGNSQASFALQLLKESYKNSKSDWKNK